VSKYSLSATTYSIVNVKRPPLQEAFMTHTLNSR
jgi:hypothetical protein